MVQEWRGLDERLVNEVWVPAFSAAQAEVLLLRKTGNWVSGPTSLLGVLGLRGSELVHSRILGWLLDPFGSHRLGAHFINGLLNRVDPDAARSSIETAVVSLEEPTVDPLTGHPGALDVVVRTPDHTIVIENKVWASESGDQLDRYARAQDGDDVVLVFLTPFRSAPRHAVESADRWRLAGWRDDVLPLLIDACSDAEEPADAVADYITAIREEIL